MNGRGVPAWTGVIIGLLFGLLVGAGWLLVRERAVASAPARVLTRSAAPTSDGAGRLPAAAAQPAVATTTGDDLGYDRRNAIVRATEAVAPAVVSINVIEYQTYRQSIVPPGYEFWDRFYPGLFPSQVVRRPVQALGSGVIVSPDGYVITNNHVVEGADELVATLSDGRQFKGRVIETVPSYDLALVKIDGENLPVAPLAASRRLYIGEWAIAIGSPFGYLLADTQPTVTVGVISALNRDIKRTEDDQRTYLGMIQTDAAINPGNSGGPLVDAAGEVVGINTFIFSRSGGSEGIGFAIPIERAKWLISEVREYGRFRQPWYGVLVSKLSPNLMRSLNLKDPVGFLVQNVEAGSPAERAGLRPGDILRSINGVPLKDVDTVTRLIYEARVGDRLAFQAERDGRSFNGTIVLEEQQRRGR
ncbi:MAG: S1C family serine protease [Candidatus Krumholzibacteriia bacterium]